MSQIKLHPTTLLLAWMLFALAIARFDSRAMLAASFMAAGVMAASGVQRCWRLVRRTRILLVVMLCVYAFMTPGMPLFEGLGNASPSVRGTLAGLQQVWRLSLMIATLAALLARLSRPQLLVGIYFLLLPLKPLRVPVERFAVRLWLTLHYVEQAPKLQGLGAHWDHALTLPRQIETGISLEAPDFTRQDVLFALGFCGLLGMAIW